jgi:hypothetical protein
MRSLRFLALLTVVALPGVGATPLAAQEGGGPQVEVNAYLVVLASRLNIREAPALDAPVAGVALRGQRLCAVRYSGDWAEVRTVPSAGDGAPTVVGFASRGFLSEVRAEVAELERLGCRSS